MERGIQHVEHGFRPRRLFIEGGMFVTIGNESPVAACIVLSSDLEILERMRKYHRVPGAGCRW